MLVKGAPADYQILATISYSTSQTYCELDPQKYISVKFESRQECCRSVKCAWKYHLQNICDFFHIKIKRKASFRQFQEYVNQNTAIA